MLIRMKLHMLPEGKYGNIKFKWNLRIKIHKNTGHIVFRLGICVRVMESEGVRL